MDECEKEVKTQHKKKISSQPRSVASEWYGVHRKESLTSHQLQVGLLRGIRVVRAAPEGKPDQPPVTGRLGTIEIYSLRSIT